MKPHPNSLPNFTTKEGLGGGLRGSTRGGAPLLGGTLFDDLLLQVGDLLGSRGLRGGIGLESGDCL